MRNAPASYERGVQTRRDDKARPKLCIGAWPDFCYEVWPVTRQAYCKNCLENYPSKVAK